MSCLERGSSLMGREIDAFIRWGEDYCGSMSAGSLCSCLDSLFFCGGSSPTPGCHEKFVLLLSRSNQIVSYFMSLMDIGANYS